MTPGLHRSRSSDGPLAQLRQQLAPLVSAWQGLGPRERLGAQAAGLTLALLLFWLIAVAPALRTLRSAPAQLDAVEAQLQDMQRLAQETRELRELPAVPLSQATEALKAASDYLGASASLNITADRAVLTLKGVSSEALQDWLTEVRSAARARPVEAQLQRGPAGFSGSIVLSLGGPT